MSTLLAFPDSEVEKMVNKGIGDVFLTMLQSKVLLDSVKRIEKGQDSSSPLSHLDESLVVGNVGFVGKITGMVYIAMSDKLAREIAKKMLGMDDDDIAGEHEMINDVIGEITNMSAGAYKNQMADKGYPCRLTLPSIIRGKYFVVESADASFRQIYSFKFNEFPFTFELIMKQGD